MPKILTLNKIAAVGLAEFPESYVCGADVTDPDAVLVRSASMHETALPASVLAIARAGAGVNNIPIDACTQAGVCVFNTPGANANAVKELVIASLFLASRKVGEALDWCKTLKGQGAEVGKLVEKGKGAFGGPEVLGKTLGLIGVGAIGGLVAQAAKALGMTVVGVDPYLSDEAKTALSPCITLLQSADEVLAQSDYISLHAPLTAETKGFICAQSLAKAKDGVRILNFSRADLVNSGELLAALQSGKAAAYVTDFPTDDLIGVPGVTAIPHLGASTPESEDNCAIMGARQLTAYLERGEIKNSVNLPALALPEKTGVRVCVIYKGALDLAAYGKVYSAKRGDVGYAVFEGEADAAAIAALPGVLRVRVLK